ncbi:hypothetical protein EOE18_15370 [Novosphingobium umbonatum]|uniref:Uncharacterized protein n=1 Tax=Novosphingobium umbonatum TaxID=1908524 RepID=A0A3S2VR35_9SPHN|nr:hypothetical protein [Novosphingobium umbonatum]RVU03500.1 hypothetical protein EOE18_15370 [Novosphingobium umbonatum]
MSKTPAGVILFEGPSQIDGKPIVVIATGLAKASRNAKTGAMVQTYIIRADIHPLEAVRSGEDASICGTCPHRGDGTGKDRSCYVTLIHGPRTVFEAYKRGVYPKVTAAEGRALLAGRMVRLGTYGDPAAAPFSIWSYVTGAAQGWTGYTHQWRAIPAMWSRLVMASADSLADVSEAQAKGYRTFRVTASEGENVKGLEVICPASEEAGKKTECAACRACMGTSGKAKVSIAIAAHGGGAKHARKRAS